MLNNIEDEARRLIAAAGPQALTLRLLGGLAVRVHAPSAAHRTLQRDYADIDLATPTRHGRKVETWLEAEGYTPDPSFNLLNGASRLLFFDEARARQIDIFVGEFAMCHRVALENRLDHDPLTLPLAELLLTKLQIVRMNEKDIRDICALLLDHPLAAGDHETINLPLISELCARDWGWWKTISLSLAKVRAFCDRAELPPNGVATIRERLEQLEQALAATPKSTRWKMRAAIGERVRWHEEAEEVERG